MLGVNVRRPVTGKPPSRTNSAFRRRLVVGVLVVLALVLITFSFRKPDDGPIASVQSAAAAVLRPFTIAGERVAQPFRDVYAWGDSLLTARSDAKKLREENAALRQQAIQNQFAANENDKLKALLAFRDGPRFPSDYTGLAAAVIARPTGGFAQDVVVAVGSNDGVALDAPVVTEDGFLGRVTRVYSRSARVTLLTDEQLAVSALDVKSGAAGIVKHGRASASTLIFDRVPKKLKVSVGDTIVTAGWRSSKLASLYPARDPDRAGDERRAGRHRPVEAGAGGAVRRLRPRRRGPRARPQGRAAVSPGTAAKIALIVFFVAIMQVSAFSSITIGGAGPNVLLVTLVSVALLRGSITGAVAGFLAGLIVDVTTLGTLGLTSLLLTLAGYWAGRYGETTGRGRPHAPLVATVAATVFVEVGGYTLDSLLGGAVDMQVGAAHAARGGDLERAARLPGVRPRSAGSSARPSGSSAAREVELLV